MSTTQDDTAAKAAPELPKRLSPSRMSDFKKCPKAFFFKSVERIPTKPTEAQIKGTLVHAVLENLFELPRERRTVPEALALLPGEWDKLKAEEIYLELVASLDEESFLADARQLVENYFVMERPHNFDPDGREMWVRGEVEGQAIIGVIDRLDRVERRDGSTTVYISDYKTGKVPKERYRKDAFFAMTVYALMRHQDGEKVDQLRLIYLKGASKEAILRLDVDDATLRKAEREVAAVVKGIRQCHESGEWPTQVGPLCNWCDYQAICPEFAGDGTPVELDPGQRIKPW